MLFGLGAVGEVALQILARMDGIDRIVATGRNEVLGVFKMKTAALGATYQGFSKKYEFHQNDARDIDATVELLEKIKPDVILLVASLRSPQVLGTTPMPAEARTKFRAAGFGVQLPWQLLIPFKFMQALEKSGIDTTVINGSFPDITSPALWNHFGFGPTLGMGNVDLTAAEIIRYVSDVENVPTREVMLSLVSSHAFLVHGIRQEVPFFSKILVGDHDLTHKHSVKDAVRAHGMGKGTSADIKAATTYFNYVTASSAVRNIMAIVDNTNEYTHAPSPNGLIGGYPVRLNSKGVEVILPSDLTLAEAIEINKAAEKFDGIEEIKDDGTIVFTDQTYSLMKELGYDCQELTFDDLERRSQELQNLLEKLQAQVK